MTQLRDLPVGAKLRDKMTSPVTFVVADKEQYADAAILLADRIIMQACLDAPEKDNPDPERRKYGSNDYPLSNLHQWLNADQASWYRPAHEYDVAPSAAAVKNGFNAYDMRPGFLSLFSGHFRAALMEKDIPYSRGVAGMDSFRAKVYLPSLTEIGMLGDDAPVEGRKFRLVNDFRMRFALPSLEAMETAECKPPVFDRRDSWVYWLRSSHPLHSGVQYLCHSHGPYCFYGAYETHPGVRPACCISPELAVCEAEDGVFVVA